MRWRVLLTYVVACAVSPAGVSWAQTKFTVSPENQPTDTVSTETMKRYSDLNQKLVDDTDKPVSTCLKSYAVYQACKAGDAATECGIAATCRVTTMLPKMSMVGIDLIFTPGDAAAAIAPAGAGSQAMKMIKQNAFPSDKNDGSTGVAHESVPADVPGMGNASTAPARPNGPARISGGVIQGLRTVSVQPVYPPAARAAHMSGTVVLHAIIGKDGAIERLGVASSTNGVFDSAAVDAVSQWHYRPYILNGNPSEVSTTITVNFALSEPPKLQTTPGGSMSRPDEHIPSLPH